MFRLPIHASNPLLHTFAVITLSMVNLFIAPLSAQTPIKSKDTTERIEEVVISGTLQEVSKSASAVPIEIYSAQFFRSNPTPSLFEGLFQVNGVQPQVNCNVCSAGDIHINGMEGPYTLVLIDGMPIVSGLSTVYGLFGIPQSLIERIEIVKGPASTLYGSEAVGGLINVITKKTHSAPKVSLDLLSNSWGETNLDVGGKLSLSRRLQLLVGVNAFNYQQTQDKNRDMFTDIPAIQRLSIFNKWSFQQKNLKAMTLATRWVSENRWGGDIRWNPTFRGGDSIYGESIETRRWEILGSYPVPIQENLKLQFSSNGHRQNSYYRRTHYQAIQRIHFAQLVWNKSIQMHSLLLGLAYRYTFYDDNSPATETRKNGFRQNLPSQSSLPGIFIQDEIQIHSQHKLLAGLRLDYNSIHGPIVSPRLNYKWNSKNESDILRFSFGNGYRVANIFTEDHASLTGAREVVFTESLHPERSWNANFNWVKSFHTNSHFLSQLDASIFYTRFSNKIIANYDIDPNLIVYSNLHGFSVSRGFAINFNTTYKRRLTSNMGITVLDVFVQEEFSRWQPLFQSRFSAVWLIRYDVWPKHITVEYTGNLHSPMRLPLLGPLDPRMEFSPWWSLQNVQFRVQRLAGIELSFGIKNLLNWTPNVGNPFLIARSEDPFDKHVEYDTNGQILATSQNPYALSFDPSYVFAPNQGRRVFLGLKLEF